MNMILVMVMVMNLVMVIILVMVKPVEIVQLARAGKQKVNLKNAD